MNIGRVLPIFAAAFAVIYAIAVEMNIAAVTYHPQIGEWGLGTQAPRTGPAMHWYGWLVTATVGATVVSAIALPFTKTREPPAWLGWAVPLATMIAFLWFLRSFFVY